MALINDESAPLEAKLRVVRGLLRVQEPRVRPARPGIKARRESAAEDAARGVFEPPPLPRKPN
jgi:hypothetical protein